MVWDAEQYWLKAIRYTEIASQIERDEWERPFWLSLSLEFLARGALTKVHPVLNADPQDDGANILYAFGTEIKGQPKSLPIHAVLLRLEKLFPEKFTKLRREFCDYFSNLRNQEVHTSELPFEGLSEKKWLARYYDVCDTLCFIQDRKLAQLVGEEEAESAAKLIGTLKSDKLSAVKSKIAAHAKVFGEKTATDRKKLADEQATLAGAWVGTAARTTCPACKSAAKIAGSIERTSKPIYADDRLYVKVVVLADRLECRACGLTLTDLDELQFAEVDPHFEFEEETELHEYHEADFYVEYDNM